MLNLIIIGILQALLLPGWLVTHRITSIATMDRVLLAVPLSLLINYIIVLFLYCIGAYTQVSIIVIVLVEFLVICYGAFVKRLKGRTGGVNEPKANLFVLSAFVVFYVLLYKDSFMTVFLHSDAIVSWNRWAEEISEGRFNGSWGYPQGLPALYSLIYTIAGNTNLQVFSKLLACLYPFFGGMALIRAGNYCGSCRRALYLSSFVFVLLLSRSDNGIVYLFSGYADPIVGVFGAYLLYVIYMAKSNKITWVGTDYSRYGLVVILIMATSALIKLTGLLLLVGYCIYIIANEKLRVSGLFKLQYIIPVAIVSLHWYLFSTLYYDDWVGMGYMTLLNPSYLSRFQNAGMMLVSWMGVYLTGLFIFAFFVSYSARLLFFVFILPVILFWGWAISYDIRGMFVVAAFISFICSVAVVTLVDSRFAESITSCCFVKEVLRLVNAPIRNIIKSATYSKGVLLTGGRWFSYLSAAYGCMRNYSLMFVMVAFVLVQILVMRFISEDKILTFNYEKRVAVADFGGNQKIMEILGADIDAKVLSCWQPPSGLPGARYRYIASGDCTKNIVARWLKDDSIKHYLYWVPRVGEDAYPVPEYVRNKLVEQGFGFEEKYFGDGFILFSKVNLQ